MSEQKQVTHPEMVSMLAKSGADIRKTITAEQCHLLHMILGVAGETGELLEALGSEGNRDWVTEEMGDFEFYMEGLRQGLDISYDKPNPFGRPPMYEALETLQVNVGNLIDMVKKEVIYGAEVAKEVYLDLFIKIEQGLSVIRKMTNIQLEDVTAANMAKLSKRYPQFNYSDQSAKLRADKIEKANDEGAVEQAKAAEQEAREAAEKAAAKQKETETKTEANSKAPKSSPAASKNKGG